MTTMETASERDLLVERLMRSTAGLFDIFTTYLGDRLGFYHVLAVSGPATSQELAKRCGTDERYTREWLEQQSVIGTLRVDDAAAAAAERRYRLPEGHAEVLVERDSPAYLAPLAQLLVGTVAPVDAVLQAFRSGRGVPFAQYGRDMLEGQGGLNRVAFLTQLGQEWIPSLPDVHVRLQSDPPARVAEVGCGIGWASIGLAREYPKVRIDGFDLDARTIEVASANAQAMGVAHRVAFQVGDVASVSIAAEYDLVLAFECIHDMADPVGVLGAMRGLAGERGAVVIMDERVGESFAARNEDTEWFMYGFSVLHCLPACRADTPSAATGTVMREATLRKYALEAGFRDVTALPIDNYFYAFYRLIQ